MCYQGYGAGCLTQNLKKKKVPSPTFSLACLQDYEIHELNESSAPTTISLFSQNMQGEDLYLSVAVHISHLAVHS